MFKSIQWSFGVLLSSVNVSFAQPLVFFNIYQGAAWSWRFGRFQESRSVCYVVARTHFLFWFFFYSLPLFITHRFASLYL